MTLLSLVSRMGGCRREEGGTVTVLDSKKKDGAHNITIHDDDILIKIQSDKDERKC